MAFDHFRHPVLFQTIKIKSIMNPEIQKLEIELSDIFRKNCLPDINTYPNSSFQKGACDGMFGDNLLFIYVKFEDQSKNRHWSLMEIYNSIRGYTDSKYIELLRKNIEIFKSIYNEN